MCFILLALSCVVVDSFTQPVHAQVRIVAPSGTDASVDGNASSAEDNTGYRAQELYIQSDFDLLPAGGAWLVSVAERADARQRRTVTVPFRDMKLTTSTTQSDNLSPVYDENIGPNPVVAFDGPIELTYEVTNETPNPFSATWNLRTPYFYNPADGNLLLDWVTVSGGTSLFLDAQSTSYVGNRWSGPRGTIGSSSSRNAIVELFTFVNPDRDLNGDGTVSSDDVNALSLAIQGMASGDRFDLNISGSVDAHDLEFMVEGLLSTWFGDANLDGAFNSSDLVATFMQAKYETGQAAGWNEGDWNADGKFDSGDLVIAFNGGGYESGPRSAVTIPEPTSFVFLITGALCGTIARSQTRCRGVLPNQD